MPSLWGRSAPWRWLLAGGAALTLFTFVGAPWRTPPSQQTTAQARFDPAQVASVRTPGPAPLPAPSGASPAAAPAVAPPAPGPVAAAPAQVAARPTNHLKSSAVWSNASGSVSGGGLIAAYCCAGASSTVFANTQVASGLHYWELTLSVRPGAEHPDTWTTAGVAPAGTGKYVRPSGPQPRGDGITSVIPWGQWKRYRNGDVFMFALDADKSLFYYGVNGQWINGQPGVAGGERVAPAPLVAYANLSASSANKAPEGDRWIANFGASPFRYPVPAGFVAYGSEAVAQPLPIAQPQPVALKNAAPVVSPVVNRIFEGEIRVAGHNVPLPDGRWLGLAYFRGTAGATDGETVALGRIERGELVSLIAINAYRHEPGAERGFAQFSSCERLDYVYVSKTANEPFGDQRCWWINHATQLWEQPLFKAAKGVLLERGVEPPVVLVNVAFRRADKAGYVTMFHYHVPADAALRGPPTAEWASSPWHRDRISTSPDRIAYVQKLRAWGEGWEPVFAAYQ